MPIVAVAEAGSMSLRLEVLDTSGGQTVSHGKLRHDLQLGAEVFEKGELSNHTTRRIVDAFHTFRGAAKRLGAEKTIGVATSALRSARNGAEVCHRVTAETGIPLRIIDGREEARFIRESIQRVMSLEQKRALLVDIGGGSVEMSVIDAGRVIREESSEKGAVRLLQFYEADNGKHRVATAVGIWCAKYARSLSREHGAKKALDLCIGTGGTSRALGELRKGILGKDRADRLKLDELASILEVLTPLSSRKMQKQFGLKPSRAEVIVPAGMLLYKIMASAGVDRILIPDVRLRHAVAHSVAA